MPNDITKGLKMRPKYDDLINYFTNHQEKIKYHNRIASNIVLEVINKLQEAPSEAEKRKPKEKEIYTKLLDDVGMQEQAMFQYSGVSVDIDNFKEIYKARLSDPAVHWLEGGSSNNYKTIKQQRKQWNDLQAKRWMGRLHYNRDQAVRVRQPKPETMDKDVQTMDVKHSRIEYIKKALGNIPIRNTKLNPMPTPIAIKVPESVAPLIPIPIREEVQHAIAIHSAVGVPATLTGGRLRRN
jgi:hypothetical protein